MNYKEKVIELYQNRLIDDYDKYIEYVDELNNGIIAYRESILRDHKNLDIEYELYDYGSFCNSFLEYIEKSTYDKVDTSLIASILNNMVIDKVKIKV
jgi:hypothetical protein